MAIQDDLRGIFFIALKDVKAYYLKPPALSWGILLPMALSLAFYLRSPEGFRDMMPGLVAMTVLFSTTAMEAVVITFELRIGALERLLLAPISLAAVLIGKVLGGVVFGLGISFVVAIACVIGLGLLHWSLVWLLPVLLFSTLVFSGLGAFISASVGGVFEAQTVANFIRFPMIFLCGVFVPLSSLPSLLHGIARLLPLTYTVEGLQGAVTSSSLTGMLVDLVLLAAFAATFLSLALMALRKRLA